MRYAGQQVGMRHQHPGTAVGEDVGDLVGLEVPVDRHRVGAEPHSGEGGFQEGEVVAQQQRGAVARLQPQRREARRGARHALVEGLSRERALTAGETG